ncbi:alpha/beta fold hydrolase [Clostridium sp. SHJSY1]|uniref:alpha/beta hydrolase n=1 Tax=Clostridium sp. SHJSY1 TaxID=2942483 RepID=UPI0028764888|nr:alpha/beta fold hydrolase [Clostridium sp. SHJSY1]MDS0528255.1 alpha/beta fold hydrolase [Clostridium sp. SHJSY1]
MENINLKDEYFFKGNEIGCIVIHGFTGTPAELRELGERLRDEGYTVYGVKLAHHGTTVEDFEKSKYTDWISSVEAAYKRLKTCCSKIYVIGHSMGGVLTLNLAENYDVDKLVLLSPAMMNKDKNSLLVPVLKHFIKYTQWAPMERPEQEAKYLLGYNKIPLACVHELLKLQKVTKSKLNKIDSHILIIHSEKDNAIDKKGIDIIEKTVESNSVQKVTLSKCGHNITVECEKETVFKEVIEFLR